MVAQSNYGHSVADDVGTDPLLRRGTNELAPPPRRDSSYVRRAPSSAGLYEVLDLVLDKGIVIDAFVRVSLVGIELVTVDLRVVIASVDTYLRYAEGAERLKLYAPRGGEETLPEMVGAGKDQGGVPGMMMKRGVKKIKDKLTGGHDEGEEDDEDKGHGEEGEGVGVGERLAHGVRNVLTRGVGRIMEKVSGEERDDSHDPRPAHHRDRGRTGNGNGKHDRGRDRSEKRAAGARHR